MVYQTASAFTREADDGEQVRLVYDSYHSDGKRGVVGTINDGILSHRTVIETDEKEYVVMGPKSAGREIGEVVVGGTEYRRTVGEFARAIPVNGPE